MPELIIDSIDWLGTTYQLEYWATDTFADLPLEKCKQHYGICFCNGKLVIGWGGKKQTWGLLGGTVEPNESLEQTLKRELIEEANMEVIVYRPLGIQKVIKPNGDHDFQLRSVCLVKPLGPFESDPAGSITKIELIDPAKYKDYFDWGKIGDRIMRRAVELLPTLG